jgi:predicted nucleic acid-binding protein
LLALVDTSIWINLLGRSSRFRIADHQFSELVTCSPILQEILQGIREDRVRFTVKERFLALLRVEDPVSLECYLEAAEIYVSGRRRGLTIRSSGDCLIAAIAIRHKLMVWHSDRDFDNIAKFTSLRTSSAHSL